MTREEIKDFCDMKAQLEPENEDIYKAIVKALEQEPTTKNDLAVSSELDKNSQKLEKGTAKNDLGVDCIVDVLGSYTDLDIPYKREIAENILAKLPSVTPIRPKGHWIKGYTFPDGEYWKCDKCNELIKVKYPMHYCNNCGSDNREVEE